MSNNAAYVNSKETKIHILFKKECSCELYAKWNACKNI